MDEVAMMGFRETFSFLYVLHLLETFSVYWLLLTAI